MRTLQREYNVGKNVRLCIELKIKLLNVERVGNVEDKEPVCTGIELTKG